MPRTLRGSKLEEWWRGSFRADQRSLGVVSLVPKICSVSSKDEREIWKGGISLSSSSSSSSSCPLDLA